MLQGVFPVRGSLGQLATQLHAAEPRHAVWRESLHHRLRLPRGSAAAASRSRYHSHDSSREMITLEEMTL